MSNKLGANLLSNASNVHYLRKANPFKTIDSLSNFIADNLLLTENKDVVLFNKPPGFVIFDKSKDPQNFIQILSENVKKHLKWSSLYKLPTVSNEQSGAVIAFSNKDLVNTARKTMVTMFPSSHTPFLKFYGITNGIPKNEQGKEVFHVSYQHTESDVLYYEEKNVSNSKFKRNKILTTHVEHQVLDVNYTLRVSLVQFNTTMNIGDGILLYCLKNLCPILGDHKYSSRLKSIMGHPVLAPNPLECKPEPQKLSNLVLKYLELNEYLTQTIPLHLHLHEINLEKKFRKQTFFFKHQTPLLPYFEETMHRFNLKLPETQPTEEIEEENITELLNCN